MNKICLLILAIFCPLYGFCQESTVESATDCRSMSDMVSTREQFNLYDHDGIFQTLTEEGEVAETTLLNVSTENQIKKSLATIDYKETKYWGRYTALRTAGWITFGAGMGFFIGGYAMILGAWTNDGDAADSLGVAGSLMLFSAPVLVLTSIPLLGCAYWNRRKAKKMRVDIEATLLHTNAIFKMKTASPAIGLALNF